MAGIFYVYEWWRPDKNVCFYVGKGKQRRAWEFRRRNNHCSRIIAKLISGGLAVEVRIISSGLEEATALSGEVERIAFWRANGIGLSNRTLGGEGVSGLKHSEATRLLLKAASARRIGRPVSEETRQKISEANKRARPPGWKNPQHSARLKGRKLSEEHKAKISFGLLGRQHSEETRAKIGSSNSGKIRSEETIAKLRDSHLGFAMPDETKKKIGEASQKYWDGLSEEGRAEHSRSTSAALATPEARLNLLGRKRPNSALKQESLT